MSVTETAVFLGCTITHIYNMVRAGRFVGAERLDGKWRIPKTAVLAHLERCKRRAGLKQAA